ncbi:MAG: FAD-dependent monooxygenase [Candidatus Puniceispirillaceae bacterium]
MMTHQPTKRTDIALVGGGLTTYMMAAVLQHSGYDFVWFSGAEPDARQHKDTRTTTLHHAGKKMLETLGVWDRLGEHAWPLTDIHVEISHQHPRKSASDQHQDGYKHTQKDAPQNSHPWPLHFASDAPPMGYVVDNQKLQDALEPLTKNVPRQACKITRTAPASPCQIETDTSQQWECDLLIACDGPASPLRAQAGLQAKKQDRGQTAIVTNIQTSRAINHTAWQIFCPEGPLALMATNSHQASVVWTVSDSKAREILALEDTDFNAALQASFGNNLGDLSVCSPRLVWPLRPVFVRKRVAEGFVLAGDAAHALHPLAGMGYNLALGDAAVLLDCLQQARQRGLSAGHISVTTAYQNRRNAEILALTGVTQILDRMLSRKRGPLTALGAAGMAILGRTALRHRISNIAMGGTLSPAPLFSGKLHS